MKLKLIPLLLLLALMLLLSLGLTSGAMASSDVSLPRMTVTQQPDGSWLAVPSGPGPFPGVLYNHGGMGTIVGGDLEATSRALAAQGYIGYAKARAITSESIPDSFVDVSDGLDELLEVPTIDNNKIAILGYSRGGLLSLRLAELNPELFDGVVLMAPAPGAVFGDGSTTMDAYLEDVSSLGSGTQFLLLVAANDMPPAQEYDHVEIIDEVEASISAVAGIGVSKIEYPAYSDDGHDLFQSISEGGQELLLQDGHYWSDVVDHIESSFLTPSPPLTSTAVPGVVGWGLAVLAVTLLMVMAANLFRHREDSRQVIGP